MKKSGEKRYPILFILLALAALLAFGQDILPLGDVLAPAPGARIETGSPTASARIDEDGAYFDKENVALYIHVYGRLPNNFITKSEARKLGWESGSVEKFAPGHAIGGDHFGNYEGALPDKSGRRYTECDIGTRGASSRGAERIVFSNDGLVYYTPDHYQTFDLLYGKE